MAIILSELTKPQLRALRLLGESGTSRASKVLSKWIHEPISLTLTQVDILELSAVPDLVGGHDVMIVAILLPLVGDIEGNFLLTFSEGAAQEFVKKLTGKDAPPLAEWGEMEQSVLQETGNILASNFMNAICGAMGIKSQPQSPMYAWDLAGALMEGVLLEYALEGDEVILMETTFVDSSGAIGSDSAKVDLFLIPTPASLETLIKNLGIV
ncbi:MAG: chemotaxis protein CheC [Candidatus Lindowbacteria bacterium]|nr:chemotaxis protein CheC [Candidatus Lindowbacteria bacterium]